MKVVEGFVDGAVGAELVAVAAAVVVDAAAAAAGGASKESKTGLQQTLELAG